MVEGRRTFVSVCLKELEVTTCVHEERVLKTLTAGIATRLPSRQKKEIGLHEGPAVMQRLFRGVPHFSGASGELKPTVAK